MNNIVLAAGPIRHDDYRSGSRLSGDGCPFDRISAVRADASHCFDPHRVTTRTRVGATLESKFAQTWQDREIIAVDDGSTDGTSAHLESFVTRGVKVVRQPNRPSAAHSALQRRAATSFSS
jgi:hypothetical protein